MCKYEDVAHKFNNKTIDTYIEHMSLYLQYYTKPKHLEPNKHDRDPF